MPYESIEWKAKRSLIISRDSHKCRKCKAFDPSGGDVGVITDFDDVQIHTYTPNHNGSTYSISSSKYKITFDLLFEGCWLMTPRLQVHHKKYIEGREVWEYEDEDLITLCKECHIRTHQTELIPIYDINGILKTKTFYPPYDIGNTLPDRFGSWILVKKNATNTDYEISGIYPEVEVLIFEGQDSIEIKKNVLYLTNNFMRQFLPKYKKTAHNTAQKSNAGDI